jgi:hypothetical protein
MARIPEEVIERLKEEVSLQRLVELGGVELRRLGAADAYYVTESGFTVDGWGFPTKFGTAYAWYRGSSRNGAELFWAGRYGWLWKVHPNVP